MGEKIKSRKVKSPEELVPNFADLPLQIKNVLIYAVHLVRRYKNKYLTVYHLIDGMLYGNPKLSEDELDIKSRNIDSIVNNWRYSKFPVTHYFEECPKKVFGKKFYITEAAEKFFEMLTKYKLENVDEMYLALSFGINSKKIYEDPKKMGYTFISLEQYSLTAIDFCNKSKGWDVNEFQNNLDQYREFIASHSYKSVVIDEVKDNPENNTSDSVNQTSNEPTNCTDLQFYEAELLRNFETKYTKDLTYEFSELDDFPKIIGRKKEIDKLAMLLSKKEKNNVVIIGKEGVGKRAIVQGFIQTVLKHSKRFKGTRILELNIFEMLSGSKYRGDFEQRISDTLKGIEKIIKRGIKVIIYIPEISNIVGAGKTDDNETIDAGSLLLPFIEKNDIRVIGTTSFEKYKKFERNKSLSQLFSVITVEEPDFETMLNILKGRKAIFENHFNVVIKEEVLKKIIVLSERYIPGVCFPYKAIDMLDEICATVSIQKSIQLIYKLKIDDVYYAISEKTRIPMEKIKNSGDLKNISDILKSTIIGQDSTIEELTQVIKRSKLGLQNPNKPLLTALFVGPTGVGKTETAKAISSLLFDKKMIRFDMSEYMEENSVAKLIGAPPGYVGYKEGGILTDAVKRNPYSLILFDEVEKAHPKLMNVMLQILDEGCLTDSFGERVNFKNTIIILTSNVGAKEATKKAIGFENVNQRDITILQAVKDKFSPEFLNRLDLIANFNALDEKNILKIANINIKKMVCNVCKERGIDVELSEDVAKFVVKNGFNPEYGAREIQRTINRLILNPISDFLIDNPNTTKIIIDIKNGSIVISDKVKKKELALV